MSAARADQPIRTLWDFLDRLLPVANARSMVETPTDFYARAQALQEKLAAQGWRELARDGERAARQLRRLAEHWANDVWPRPGKGSDDGLAAICSSGSPG